VASFWGSCRRNVGAKSATDAEAFEKKGTKVTKFGSETLSRQLIRQEGHAVRTANESSGQG
jgi:hypothetical protein